MKCWKCGQSLEAKDKIQRKDACSQCGSDLRCCYNCHFYDKQAYHQCGEPQAEWVRYKEKGNFCDFFRPRRKFFRVVEKPLKKNDQKNKWDSLFKDES